MGRGRFIWHELLTRDIPAAKAFYGRLFGWKMRTVEVPELGPYTLVHDGDREALGICDLREAREPEWIPSVWVDSIPEAAKATVFWGGDIRAGPANVAGIGEILMVRDPFGAQLTLCDPDPNTPARPDRTRVGSMFHHVLVTRDLERAETFYGKLLGWKLKMVEIAPGKKLPIFTLDRGRIAAIHLLGEGEEAPCYWVCGVGVKNLPTAHQRAVQLGATSIVPPTRFGKLGSTDLLIDPVDAIVSLFEPASRSKK